MGLVLGIFLVVVAIVAALVISSRKQDRTLTQPNTEPSTREAAPAPESEPKLIELTHAQCEKIFLELPKAENGEVQYDDIMATRERMLAPYQLAGQNSSVDWNFDSILDECKMGELVFEYEDSVHGDCDICTVYVLSRATAVVTRDDIHDEFHYFVFTDWTTESLIAKLESMLTEGYDEEWEECYSPWDDEEWTSEDENTVRRTGMADLRKNLANFFMS